LGWDGDGGEGVKERIGTGNSGVQGRGLRNGDSDLGMGVRFCHRGNVRWSNRHIVGGGVGVSANGGAWVKGKGRKNVKIIVGPDSKCGEKCCGSTFVSPCGGCRRREGAGSERRARAVRAEVTMVVELVGLRADVVEVVEVTRWAEMNAVKKGLGNQCKWINTQVFVVGLDVGNAGANAGAFIVAKSTAEGW